MNQTQQPADHNHAWEVVRLPRDFYKRTCLRCNRVELMRHGAGDPNVNGEYWKPEAELAGR